MLCIAYIYIRGEFYDEASNLQVAINEAYKGNASQSLATGILSSLTDKRRHYSRTDWQECLRFGLCIRRVHPSRRRRLYLRRGDRFD